MTTIDELCQFLEAFAPRSLAEEWDNVGLLVGDRAASVDRLMACLTITPTTVAEAVRRRADVIVAHHPLPFKPLKRLTTDSTPGRLLLDLIHARIAVYSPHTAFDSAAGGINQQLAEGLGLVNIKPLIPAAEVSGGGEVGGGRFGEVAGAATLADLSDRLRSFLRIANMQFVGSEQRSIARVAVACGSAGSFLEPALRAGCDLLVTGETTFHTCLEAEANDIALLLPGHYASERFAVERLAETLAREFPSLEIWASTDERDPIRNLQVG